jgi:hypothetical protein
MSGEAHVSCGERPVLWKMRVVGAHAHGYLVWGLRHTREAHIVVQKSTRRRDECEMWRGGENGGARAGSRARNAQAPAAQ